MPRIPQGNFNSRLSSRVPQTPTQSISQAGMQYRGLQDIGSGIKGAANLFAQIEGQRVRSEENAFMSDVQSDTRNDFTKFDNEQKTSMKGKSHKGYAEANQKFLTDRREDYLKKATTERQKKRVNDYFDRFTKSQSVSDSLYEQKNEAAFNKTTRALKLNESVETAYEQNFDQATVSMREEASQLDDADLFTPAERANNLRRLSGIALGSVDGQINRAIKDKSEAGLNRVKEMLEGKTKYKELYASLTERQRDKALKRVENGLNGMRSIAAFEMAGEVEDISAKVQAGTSTVNDLNKLKEIDARYETMSKSGNYRKGAFKSNRRAINSAITMHEFSQEVMGADYAKLTEVRESFSEDKMKVASAKDLESLKLKQRVFENKIAAIRQDPAAVILSENAISDEGPTWQYEEGSIELARETEKRYGRKVYFSKEGANKLLSSFKSNPQAFNAWMAENANMSPKQKYEALASASALDKSLGDLKNYAFLTAVDQQAQRDFMKFSQDNEAIDLRIKERNLKKDFVDMVRDNDDFKKMDQAFFGANNSAFVGQMTKAIRNKAKHDYLNDSRFDTPEKAIQNAYDSLVGKAFFFAESGGRNLPIPAMYKANGGEEKITAFTENVTDTLEHTLPEEGGALLEKLGVKIEDQNLADLDLLESKEVKNLNDVAEAIRYRNPKLRVTGDGHSFAITYDGKDGTPQALKMANTDDVTGKKVAPTNFAIKFSDIVSATSPIAEEVNRVGAFVREWQSESGKRIESFLESEKERKDRWKQWR